MDRHRVEPGSKFRIDKVDPSSTAGWKVGKGKREETLEAMSRQLGELQTLLWAEHRHKVLIVLQGMDTSGKDGTISHVFLGINPQGVKVANFRAPTPDELDHDFLWRVHSQVPGKGEIVIWNRSHYEAVLAERVHELVPPEEWELHYDQINDFERLLAETGTTILKFLLHIDPDEQKKRLQQRLDDPSKSWKLSLADLVDRKLWKRYMEAYQDAIERTSTRHAPWYVVPANKKWYRNLVVASTLVDALKHLKMKLPRPAADLRGIVIE
ncbi:MAG: polyphosphate kinase 2 family protein [Acidobacteriota bacterium]|nr:polyphosphate kinase 2 family protein [Acidobacteriota bacterium]